MIDSLLLVGGGNIGQALLQAWHQQGSVKDIVVVDPHPADVLKQFAEVHTTLSDIDQARRFSAVVLATKPQIADTVMPGLSAFVTKDNFFLSIAAGKPTYFFEKHFGNDKAVIRTMPNTPCQIQKGITGFYANKASSCEITDITKQLFTPTGLVFSVDDEDKMHAVTGISGSGPGFVDYIMEVLEAEYGRQEAIAYITDQAMQCSGDLFDAYCSAAVQTLKAKYNLVQLSDEASIKDIVSHLFAGTAGLADSTGKSFTQLRTEVTSPNGTTAAGLVHLMQADNVDEIIEHLPATLLAATNRSYELARPVSD